MTIDRARRLWESAFTKMQAKRLPDLADVITAVFVFDGGGAVIAADALAAIRFDFSGWLVGWSIVSSDDTSGSIAISLHKRSTGESWAAIGGSAAPTLTAATDAEGTRGELTGWDTRIDDGDWLRATVASASSVLNVTLALRIRRAVRRVPDNAMIDLEGNTYVDASGNMYLMGGN